MTIYKQKKNSHLKWVIALLVFILSMTITFSDLYGVNIPADKPAADKKVVTNDDPANSYDNSKGTPNSSDTPSEDVFFESLQRVPSSVPEPSTLILISSGLGLLYLRNRRRKNQK